jgi:hypothetical protein
VRLGVDKHTLWPNWLRPSSALNPKRALMVGLDARDKPGHDEGMKL